SSVTALDDAELPSLSLHDALPICMADNTQPQGVVAVLQQRWRQLPVTGHCPGTRQRFSEVLIAPQAFVVHEDFSGHDDGVYQQRDIGGARMLPVDTVPDTAVVIRPAGMPAIWQGDRFPALLGAFTFLAANRHDGLNNRHARRGSSKLRCTGQSTDCQPAGDDSQEAAHYAITLTTPARGLH